MYLDTQGGSPSWRGYLPKWDCRAQVLMCRFNSLSWISWPFAESGIQAVVVAHSIPMQEQCCHCPGFSGVTRGRLSHSTFSQGRQWEALPLEGMSHQGKSAKPAVPQSVPDHCILIRTLALGCGGFLSFTTQMQLLDSHHESCKLNQHLFVVDMPWPNIPSLMSCKASCGEAERDSKADC